MWGKFKASIQAVPNYPALEIKVELHLTEQISLTTFFPSKKIGRLLTKVVKIQQKLNTFQLFLS